jgi:hypothetical protein
LDATQIGRVGHLKIVSKHSEVFRRHYAGRTKAVAYAAQSFRRAITSEARDSSSAAISLSLGGEFAANAIIRLADVALNASTAWA